MKFKDIETWILSLLERRIEDLDREYADDSAWSWLDEISRGKVDIGLSDETFHALHLGLYGHPCEDPLWSAIVWKIRRPLPASIAHDLLDRDLATMYLCHSRQEDEVQWRMAGMDRLDEALLTLAREFYTLETRTLTEFQVLLHRFPDHIWMLANLSLQRASSTEKETLLFAHIRRRPDADSILKVYNRAERKKHAKRIKDIEEIQQLFDTGDPYSLRGLAENLNTPQTLLEAMLEMKNTQFAKDIRDAARETLAYHRRHSRAEKPGERK